MKIGLKITAMAVLPIVLTAVFVLAIALYQQASLRDFAANEVDRQALAEAQKIAQSVYLMCRAAQEAAQQGVDANLRVATDILHRNGTVTLGRVPVRWEVYNQFDHARQRIVLPQLLVGNRWLGQNTDTARPVPIVDATCALVGGTATLFQRMNSAGDMLRVATTVTDRNGRRAIGSYIPAVEPDGTPNRVVQTLLRGETYRGRAFVVNAWYITAYQPIWDPEHQNVIGALYVGIKETNLSGLRQGIIDIVVGRTGYVWVVGGHGEQRGRYIISKDGLRDGEYLYDIRDEHDELFVRRMVEKALALPEAGASSGVPVTYDRYPWKNPGESEARYKSVAITYFAPWDWVIGAAYYESDFAPLQQRMSTALDRMALWISGAALLMVACAIPVGRLLAAGIRSHLDSILQSVNDIIIITDSSDQIFLLSQAAEELFGANLKQVYGRPLAALIIDPECTQRLASALATHRSGVFVEFDWQAPDGPRRMLQGRTSVIQRPDGTLLGMILAVNDITATRQAEKVKTELLSTAAHELNTPLTTIIGYSELLLEQAPPSSEQREALHYIHQKAWLLSRIVDDLLDVSRIESGKGLPVHREPHDVVALVHEVLHHFRQLSNNHHFSAELPTTPVVLLLDCDRFEQVLSNILNNAIKYSPGGGEIRVGAHCEADGFHLHISDSGIGMTDEQVAHIFDKFFRADSSNTAVRGTGLGMTIVRDIINAHQGCVRVESRIGVGTTIHLWLPLPAVPSPRRRLDDHPSADG
jgi:PAS domain S-box-containing protein